MVRGWILEANLEAVMILLSDAVGYRFDDSDLAAVELARASSDLWSDNWFEYPLEGTQGTARVRLAYDSEDDSFGVVVEATDAAERTAAVVIDVASRWTLTGESVRIDRTWGGDPRDYDDPNRARRIFP